MVDRNGKRWDVDTFDPLVRHLPTQICKSCERKFIKTRENQDQCLTCIYKPVDFRKDVVGAYDFLEELGIVKI